MGATRKVVLELPEEDAVLLEELVSNGVYASATAFVSANLLAERQEDPELDPLDRNCRTDPVGENQAKSK